MNTITPLNPDVKPDSLPESPKPDAPVESRAPSMDPLDYAASPMPAFEVEQSPNQTEPTRPPVAQPFKAPAAPGASEASVKSMRVVASSGFLMKYIASLFAGISVLCGLSLLSFILLDHFINNPEGLKIGSMFDVSTIVSTWHVWLVASLVTFTVVYLMLSRAAGKYLAEDKASDREIQVAEVARSIFTAVLVIEVAYLVASLLFTLLNGTLAAAEIEGKDIAIQVAGSILSFIWIGVIIKHQSSVHLTGKNGIAGIVLAVAAGIIAVLAAIFLLAAGRNAVIDSRTMSDLSTIQSKLSSYNAKNDSYPENLNVLVFDDDKIKSRLAKYKYTRTQTKQNSSLDAYDDMFSSSTKFGTTSSLRSFSTTKEGYKLCANFLTDASSITGGSLYDESSAVSEDGTKKSTSFHSHGKGEHCVENAY